MNLASTIEEKYTASSSSLSLYGSDGICESASSSLITSPQVISKFVRIDIDSNIPNKILALLRTSPLNSILLLENNSIRTRSDKDFELLSALIQICFSKDGTKDSRELWLDVFKQLVTVNGILKQHYDLIYKTLSHSISNCNDIKEKTEDILCGINLLRYISKIPITYSREPLSYFYLLSNDSSLSSIIPAKTLWPFNDGYTIIMWIKPEILSQSKENLPILMRMRSSEKGFECYIKEHILNYRTLPATYSPPSSFK